MASYDPFEKYQYPVSPPAAVEVTPVSSDPGIERYNQFLRSQNINPDTIGTAFMDRASGRMIVPTIAQEYDAVNDNNAANAAIGDLLRAAYVPWHNKTPTTAAAAMAMKEQARDLDVHGNNYTSRLKHFLEAILRDSRQLPPSANGFSG